MPVSALGQESCYRKVLTDDKSLKVFLDSLADFDQRFCDLMASGRDFTLKLEIHGNNTELLHARVLSDSFERPPGVKGRG